MTERSFTTTCPECGAPLVAVGPARVGPKRADEKPDAVICTNEDERHRFPVLERGITSDGQTQYRLGPQIEQ